MCVYGESVCAYEWKLWVNLDAFFNHFPLCFLQQGLSLNLVVGWAISTGDLPVSASPMVEPQDTLPPFGELEHGSSRLRIRQGFLPTEPSLIPALTS